MVNLLGLPSNEDMFIAACLNSASLVKAYYITNDKRSPLRLQMSVIIMRYENEENDESKIENFLEIGAILGSNLN